MTKEEKIKKLKNLEEILYGMLFLLGMIAFSCTIMLIKPGGVQYDLDLATLVLAWTIALFIIVFLVRRIILLQIKLYKM